MDEILLGFENLKISAFSKLSQLKGNINNVTIGPNVSVVYPSDVNKKEKTEKPEKKTKIKQDIASKNNSTINQILKERDTERREKLQDAIGSRCNNFIHLANSQKEQIRNQWMLKQQEFIENMCENEQIILRNIDQTDVNKANQKEKLMRGYQEMIQRKLQYEQQLERNREKHRAINEIIEKIKKCQLEFRTIYQDIIDLIKSCGSSEELKLLLEENFKLLKTLPDSFEEIVTKCKTYNISEEELVKADRILDEVRSLKTLTEFAVAKINSKKVEQAVQVTIPVPYVSNTSQETIPKLENYVSAPNYTSYCEIKQFLAQYLQLCKELSEDDRWKTFRFDCKKAINTPVNSLSATNAEHLRDKFVKLSSLLSGKTIAIADKQINASRHPQGIPFCMNLLAKKFVLQGDLMISSNPEAAFCYSSIIISLWNTFPDFGKLLLGYFYTQCPYLVPFYIPRTTEQTDEDYYSSLGYRYVDGQIESQDKFLKRITGIFRLYFAIMIARPKRGQTENPHDIKNAWCFLVSILSLAPQLDITATAIHVFLETVGYEMEIVYGMAFKKLINIIIEKCLPILIKLDAGGPVTRLEVLLQEYKVKGHFEKPHGVLVNNFW